MFVSHPYLTVFFEATDNLTPWNFCILQCSLSTSQNISSSGMFPQSQKENTREIVPCSKWHLRNFNLDKFCLKDMGLKETEENRGTHFTLKLFLNSFHFQFTLWCDMWCNFLSAVVDCPMLLPFMTGLKTWSTIHSLTDSQSLKRAQWITMAMDNHGWSILWFFSALPLCVPF